MRTPDNIDELIGEVVYIAYRPKKLAVVLGTKPHPHPNVRSHNLEIEFKDGTKEEISPWVVRPVRYLIEETEKKLHNHTKRYEEFLEHLADKEQ